MLPARSLSANVEIARKLVPVAVNEPGNTLSILPLAHIFGLAFDFLLLFSCGCHINIFTEKPVPARLLKALADVKPFIFLTVPLLIEKIFRSKVKVLNIIGIATGVALLLFCQGIFSLEILWKLSLPTILVLIGVALVFKDAIFAPKNSPFNRNTDKKVRKTNTRLHFQAKT